MLFKILANFSVFWLFFAFLVSAEGEIQLGPVNTGQPGEISVGLKYPPRNKPEASDIQLYTDGKNTATASAIKRFKLALVICVDVSGTMAGEPLAEIKDALKRFLSSDLFKPQDQISLFSVENELQRIQWFADQQENVKMVDALKWSGGQKTVLYDALYDSLEHLEHLEISAPVSRRILLISDGKDEGSKRTLQEVRDKALDQGIAIDVVARVRKNRVEEDRRKGYVQNLHALAEETRGNFEHVEPGGVQEAMERIIRDITGTSLVPFKYETDTSGQTTSDAKISLLLPGAKPLEFEIPGEIPRRKTEEVIPKEVKSRMVWLLWPLLVAVALGIGIFVWIRRGAGSKIENHELPSKPSHEKVDIQRPEEEHPTLPRRTIVGGYHFPIPKPGKPIALLIGVGGPVEGQQFSVEKEPFYIGANPSSDLCLAEDEYVSGEHAYLRYERGSLFIFDQGSRNGSFVNEYQVSTTGYALKLGDRIKIGESTLEVGKALD